MNWLREIFAPEPEWGTPSVCADCHKPGHVARDCPLNNPRPKPRLAAVNHAPGRDDFATWRDNPITLFVFAALRNGAAEQKAAWDDFSWHGGEANEKLLTELRTRADAYEAIEAADYEAFCAWASVEPQGEG